MSPLAELAYTAGYACIMSGIILWYFYVWRPSRDAKISEQIKDLGVPPK